MHSATEHNCLLVYMATVYGSHHVYVLYSGQKLLHGPKAVIMELYIYVCVFAVYTCVYVTTSHVWVQRISLCTCLQRPPFSSARKLVLWFGNPVYESIRFLVFENQQNP